MHFDFHRRVFSALMEKGTLNVCRNMEASSVQVKLLLVISLKKRLKKMKFERMENNTLATVFKE